MTNQEIITLHYQSKDSSTPSQNATANMLVTITSPANKTELESLTAKIDANSTSSNAPATIEFGANSTGGLTPYSFVWNFGDGNNGTNTSEKVSHTFDKPGDYNITLSAKDSSTPSQNATANMLVTITSHLQMVQVLTPMVQVLTPMVQVLTPMVQVLTPMVQVLTPMVQVLTPMVQVLTPMVQVLTPMVQVLTPMVQR